MNNKVYVWDPLVRFFHWTLVLTFIIAYLTGDEDNTLHIYSGYYILGLVALRILWGVIGTRYARFSHIIYSPSAVIDYLKGFIGMGSGKKYIGHNPAGGWMVIAMLISLLLTGLSGLKAYGIEGHGPLAQSSDNLVAPLKQGFIKVSTSDEDENDHEHDEEDEFWEEIHEFFANFTVLLVLLHIVGVFASSLKQRQNLVKSMWTGYKRE